MNFFEKLFGGRARKDEAVAATRVAFAEVVAPVLAKARAGGEPTDEELEQCRTSFGAFYDALSARHGSEDNTRFSEEHQADFYVEALKLAALGHPDHDAWPVMAGVRRSLWGALQKRLDTQDPWLHLCAISPALLVGQVQRALQSYARIESDPFLSQRAIAWANDAVMAFLSYNEPNSAQAFLEAVRGVSPWEAPVAGLGDGLGDERRWPLFASIYPFLSRDSRTGLADPRPVAVVRLQLQRDWSVSNREEALSIIGWLREEGHRAELAAALEADSAQGARGPYVARNRAALAKHGILAWDLCRLISVVRAAHTLGLLAEEEAWGAVLGAGNRLREEYASWKELGDDFLLGLGFWDPDALQSGGPYPAMVRWLQKDPRSPWQRVPFGAR
jgi:hypothetical protein